MTRYFDRALIHKYSQSGPRYTSYPTAVEFHPQFGEAEHIQFLKGNAESGKALSVYIHIPFCENVCFYCGCNKIITKNHSQAQQYLDYLEREMALQAQYLGGKREVVQLHFGGGTPTFLSREEQERLFAILHQHFTFAADDVGEFSIEIDPRTVTHDDLRHLRSLGFNRVSFGVQDFNPQVQQAVNRIQPYEEVKATVEAARDCGYHSISADLIYGLPKQSALSFQETIKQMLTLDTDRLAIFHYAHMPHIFGAQKQIVDSDLPSSDEKLAMLEHSIKALTENGYEFIGLDHFAKQSDSLVQHQKQGTLYRNFQGYSTFSHCDLLGFGISSISMVGNSYSQNEKARSRYYQRLDKGEIPIHRGIALNQDDLIRRYVITEIMCNLGLNLNEVSKRFGIDAKHYFSREWQQLTSLAQDDLIEYDEEQLRVKPLGRLLIRNIAMVFDFYRQKNPDHRFSKTV
ncbi:MAG: oxygen-independent coproporphyrinogen III oxidase [Cardiobacteriaceae bacterium]|nr:oxygen-independent coproporphyrinogen III oxidase [Cardiobacteriaceae bacterium]